MREKDGFNLLIETKGIKRMLKQTHLTIFTDFISVPEESETRYRRFRCFEFSG